MKLPNYFYDDSIRCAKCYLKPGIFDDACKSRYVLGESCFFQELVGKDIKKLNSGDPTITFQKLQQIGLKAFESPSELLAILVEEGIKTGIRLREIQGCIGVTRQELVLSLLYAGSHVNGLKDLRKYAGNLADTAEEISGKGVDSLIENGFEIGAVEPKHLTMIEDGEWKLRRIHAQSPI